MAQTIKNKINSSSIEQQSKFHQLNSNFCSLYYPLHRAKEILRSVTEIKQNKIHIRGASREIILEIILPEKIKKKKKVL